MAGKKRPFQILDEMNVSDATSGTSLVGICTSLISAAKVKGGANITMGAPESVVFGIMNDDLMPMLVLVDKQEYFKRQKENGN
jgi:hypothetical protein